MLKAIVKNQTDILLVSEQNLMTLFFKGPTLYIRFYNSL